MKIIEVVADAGHVDTLHGMASQYEIADVWSSLANEEGRSITRMLVPTEKRQSILDALQKLFSTSEDVQILILPVDATIMSSSLFADDEKQKALEKSVSVSREELFGQVERGVVLDGSFLLLVCLSSLVAGLGMIENNLAVIIGAMVIAPLLGPNLGFALGASLGETALVIKSLRTLFVGVFLAITFSILLGLFWPGPLESTELQARTIVDYSTTAIALASGAAASLSLVTGSSATLVGVMVAVALMPPAVTIGLMLSQWELVRAGGALHLLLINIVSISLSAKLVFLIRGLEPRTWLKAHKAKQSRTTYILIWILLLGLLVWLIGVKLT